MPLSVVSYFPSSAEVCDVGNFGSSSLYFWLVMELGTRRDRVMNPTREARQASLDELPLNDLTLK